MTTFSHHSHKPRKIKVEDANAYNKPEQFNAKSEIAKLKRSYTQSNKEIKDDVFNLILTWRELDEKFRVLSICLALSILCEVACAIILAILIGIK